VSAFEPGSVELLGERVRVRAIRISMNGYGLVVSKQSELGEHTRPVACIDRRRAGRRVRVDQARKDGAFDRTQWSARAPTTAREARALPVRRSALSS
jgi:hypothetical protein